MQWMLQFWSLAVSLAGQENNTARTTNSPECGPLCSFYHTSSLTCPLWTGHRALKRNLLISSFKLRSEGNQNVCFKAKVLMHFESGLTLMQKFDLLLLFFQCDAMKGVNKVWNMKERTCRVKKKIKKRLWELTVPGKHPSFFPDATLWMKPTFIWSTNQNVFVLESLFSLKLLLSNWLT